MLIDKVELERRLSSSRNILNTLPLRDNTKVVPLHKTKCHATAQPVPQALKVIAGVLAKTEPIKEVAEALDVSTSVVSRAKNGKEVAKAVDAVTTRIRDMALDKLMASLGIINDENLASCGAKDASLVARNLAGVVDKLTPREQAGTNVQLIVYAPKQRSEEHYDTIDIKVG